ncbi:phosphatase PAP2 family protein [Curtobacterium ammoniigenes]|uniref:phosphatase PAP2 family protein n=1 Tax=Curtobacterium ammoniigenes TaxID=395387 RepID=UPI0008342430|nr:phosphatase PAP2 family protein [Curtobacterium ammoniigenes]
MTRSPVRDRAEPSSRAARSARRARWAMLSAVGFVIVPLVYVAAVRTATGQRIEDAALSGVSRTNLFGSDTVLNVISVPVVLLLIVVVAVVGLVRRRLAVGIAAVVVLLGAGATATLFKRIAGRPEIAGSTTPNSYPSGHAAIALAALFAVLMVTPRRFRPALTVIGAAYAVVVANQTVVYGWHRMSDIVGACGVAVFWLGLVRAVGPVVDREARSDRAGRVAPQRLLAIVLGGAGGIAVLGTVIALLFAVLGGVHHDQEALLIAGRLAAIASVLITVLVVTLLDRRAPEPSVV